MHLAEIVQNVIDPESDAQHDVNPSSTLPRQQSPVVNSSHGPMPPKKRKLTPPGRKGTHERPIDIDASDDDDEEEDYELFEELGVPETRDVKPTLRPEVDSSHMSKGGSIAGKGIGGEGHDGILTRQEVIVPVKIIDARTSFGSGPVRNGTQTPFDRKSIGDTVRPLHLSDSTLASPKLPAKSQQATTSLSDTLRTHSSVTHTSASLSQRRSTMTASSSSTNRITPLSDAMLSSIHRKPRSGPRPPKKTAKVDGGSVHYPSPDSPIGSQSDPKMVGVVAKKSDMVMPEESPKSTSVPLDEYTAQHLRSPKESRCASPPAISALRQQTQQATAETNESCTIPTTAATTETSFQTSSSAPKQSPPQASRYRLAADTSIAGSPNIGTSSLVLLSGADHNNHDKTETPNPPTRPTGLSKSPVSVTLPINSANELLPEHDRRATASKNELLERKLQLQKGHYVDGNSLDLKNRDLEQDGVGAVWKAEHLIGEQWEEDEMETLNQEDCSRESSLGNSGSSPEADIRREMTTKSRHTDQIITKHIQPLKRRRSDCDQDGCTAESDVCMSDAGDDQPPPTIKALLRSDEANPDRVLNSRPMPSPQSDHSQQVSKDRRRVRVYCPDGPVMFSVSPSTRGSKIKHSVARLMKVAEDSIDLIGPCGPLYLDQTAHQMALDEFGNIAGIESEVIDLQVTMVQSGGKPVIYLYPPQAMLVDVTLSLCSQCRHECLSYAPADSYRVDLGCSSAHPYSRALFFEDSQ